MTSAGSRMAASLRRARRARRRARWSPPPRGPWSAELASLVAEALAEVRATLRALPAAEDLSAAALRARRASELVRCALARRWRRDDEFDLWAVALAVGASMRVEVRAPVRPLTVKGHRVDAARLLRALFDVPGATVAGDADVLIVRARRAPRVEASCERRAASLGLRVESTRDGARLSRAG